MKGLLFVMIVFGEKFGERIRSRCVVARVPSSPIVVSGSQCDGFKHRDGAECPVTLLDTVTLLVMGESQRFGCNFVSPSTLLDGVFLPYS